VATVKGVEILLCIHDLVEQHQSLNTCVEIDNMNYFIESIHLLGNLLFICKQSKQHEFTLVVSRFKWVQMAAML
jgi:hypothetical protein